MPMKSKVLPWKKLSILLPMVNCLRLGQEYAQFLIDFYELQEDPIQQQILESVRTIRNQHDMNQTDSIRQAIKLRKDLFMDIWPNHNIEENHEEDGASEEE